MKKAGDLLSAIFDEKLMQKARDYSDLFSAWADITARQGIAAAAAHSRIVELERFVLLVEADHPGWIQLLQTKQRELLTAVQRRFPDLTITGISFRLSRMPLGEEKPAETHEGERPPPEEYVPPGEISEPIESLADLYARIDDEDFKSTLKRLEKGIGKS
jgi:predicted nucleic acid-binding Zn ribbon protein